MFFYFSKLPLTLCSCQEKNSVVCSGDQLAMSVGVRTPSWLLLSIETSCSMSLLACPFFSFENRFTGDKTCFEQTLSLICEEFFLLQFLLSDENISDFPTTGTKPSKVVLFLVFPCLLQTSFILDFSRTLTFLVCGCYLTSFDFIFAFIKWLLYTASSTGLQSMLLRGLLQTIGE